jgi:hypothetical protein
LQAANEFGEKGLNIAKGIMKIDELGKSYVSQEAAKKSIEQLRKTNFKGNPELLYKTLQIKWGLTPGFTKILSNPPSDNGNYDSFLKGVKTEHLGGKQYMKNASDGFPREAKIADDMVKHLKPGDSILAGLVYLKNKGYDPQPVLDRIKDKYNSGKLSLDKDQERELTEPAYRRPSFGDIWYMIMSGLSKTLGEK